MDSSRSSILFIAPAPVQPSLTGPVRRVVKLAEAVAEHCKVTLAAPAPSTFPDGPFATLETAPGGDERLNAALASHDVTVAQTLPSPRRLLMALRHARRLVVDVIAPLALEVKEIDAEPATRRAVVRWRTQELLAHLAAADLVLCTNEKQRDFILGAALAGGVLDRGSPSLEQRVAIVPHGIEEVPPSPHGSPLRGNGFGADAKIAVWGGGMWSWLDPLTAVQAVDRLRPSRPELRLAFIGLDHPDPDQRRAHDPRAAEARAYVSERDLDGIVEFRPRWLPREEYVEHLLEADVGLSLHGSTLEGRYASRTRVLDYLLAGLPVVCTGGDTMSDLVAAHGLGAVVEPLDVEGCAIALDSLTRGDRQPIDSSALEPLRWKTVARPLVDFCLRPPPPRRRSRAESLAIVAREYPAFLSALYRVEGARESVAAALRRASAAVRRG